MGSLWLLAVYLRAESFLTALFSFLSLLLNGVPAWSSACLRVHYHSQFMSPTCCIERCCANRVHRHEVEGKSQERGEPGLHLGFIHLEKKNTVGLWNAYTWKANELPRWWEPEQGNVALHEQTHLELAGWDWRSAWNKLSPRTRDGLSQDLPQKNWARGWQAQQLLTWSTEAPTLPGRGGSRGQTAFWRGLETAFSFYGSHSVKSWLFDKI